MNLSRLLPALLLIAACAFPKPTIISPENASALETLAAREVRRYFYVRTGELLPIVTASQLPAGEAIVVARKDRPLAAQAGAALAAQEYVIKTDGAVVYLVGGDDSGTLYAAYAFAERLGVRFYLNGDVIPDKRIAPALPKLNETAKPIFDTRGIQPFHDFPEGPDWWDKDDYLSYVAQLPKMRMNFLGLHNYPEGEVGPEPGVWIGQRADLGEGGKVNFSYPSQWANTARKGMWGYAPMKTSDFAAGAAALFESDDFGPAVMKGVMPVPATPEQSNQLFGEAGSMLKAAFTEAKALGVKTCIGTETPLTIPKLVRGRLKAAGKDPKDRAVVESLYEGMFRRIAATYPIDYYWLWTPEDWTWGGNKPEQFEATKQDILAAVNALTSMGKPFTLATSGWVLGPQHDRAALDAFLPKDSPMSTINRQVGHAPDESGFANLQGRPKWVIPWMENDPNLTSPQPWVGRMRYDAADAKRLGCTGLLGIHWRTKILSANVAALAAAAWDQSWVPAGFESEKRVEIPPVLGEGDNQNQNPQRGRTMPVEEFYIDFARAGFGDEVAEAAGRILARIDGTNLPEPATWIKGPGGIKPEKTPWSELKQRYAFVDELAALRDKVQGAGNRERFDYWLNTYRYMAAMAEAASVRGQLDKAVADIQAEKDQARQKQMAAQGVELRTHLARVWERMITMQIAATDTPGELGTLANLEQHNRLLLRFLDTHDEALANALGSPLPAATQLSKTYTGPSRLIVPTVRTLATSGESLTLKMIAVDKQPVKAATLYWRPLGERKYKRVAAKHVARAVFSVTVPAAADFEYYIEAKAAGGKKIVWPATAPALSQTVVVR